MDGRFECDALRHVEEGAVLNKGGVQGDKRTRRLGMPVEMGLDGFVARGDGSGQRAHAGAPGEVGHLR